MGASNSVMIHRLQQAINEKFDARLLYNKSQFYSDKQDRPVTLYTIRKAIPDETARGKTKSVELFKTTSQIQIVLFLRDYWFMLNGWELPEANEQWETMRAKLAERNK